MEQVVVFWARQGGIFLWTRLTGNLRCESRSMAAPAPYTNAQRRFLLESELQAAAANKKWPCGSCHGDFSTRAELRQHRATECASLKGLKRGAEGVIDVDDEKGGAPTKVAKIKHEDAQGDAQGEAPGEAQGEAQGEAPDKVPSLRDFTLRELFGDPPTSLFDRVGILARGRLGEADSLVDRVRIGAFQRAYWVTQQDVIAAAFHTAQEEHAKLEAAEAACLEQLNVDRTVLNGFDSLMATFTAAKQEYEAFFAAATIRLGEEPRMRLFMEVGRDIKRLRAQRSAQATNVHNLELECAHKRSLVDKSQIHVNAIRFKQPIVQDILKWATKKSQEAELLLERFEHADVRHRALVRFVHGEGEARVALPEIFETQAKNGQVFARHTASYHSGYAGREVLPVLLLPLSLQQEACAICLASLVSEPVIYAGVACNGKHAFHHRCLLEHARRIETNMVLWIKEMTCPCPVCRSDLHFKEGCSFVLADRVTAPV